MLVENKTMNQEDILKVCEERENEPTISFEEFYYEGLNYNPSKNFSLSISNF